jgi:hypothetical protein
VRVQVSWQLGGIVTAVGQYTDAAKATHGFLLSLSPFDLTLGVTPVPGVSYRFISIDYPGAKTTYAYGINASGHIVGAYVDSAGKQLGFLLVRGRVPRVGAMLPLADVRTAHEMLAGAPRRRCRLGENEIRC